MTEQIPGPGPIPSNITSSAWPEPPTVAEPAPTRRRRTSPWLHLGLLLATVASTFLVGGPAYAATIMAILGAHEMGHYLLARRHGVAATLPFFIPLPLPPFGTMGAVIRMDSLGADRRQLFDIGVAGPVAGLVLAIPACIVGLALSKVVPLSALNKDAYLSLQSPLLFDGIARLLHGTIPEGQDLLLHPIAFAGWAGLFITALNLLPIGQLDGGHITYALFSRRWSQRISIIAALLFAGLAIFHNHSYILMAALTFLFRNHPPTADDSIPLTPGRRALGVALLVVLVLCFTPNPFGI